jgi:hypothetical protein
MRKMISIILVIVICVCPGLALADGVDVSSNDLINNAGEYNGKEIVYTGEMIGDILSRGEYSWINVSDGSNAIGIWVKSDDIKDIDELGEYTAHGDTVKIKGIFYRACPAHGGDMDIHAQSIEIIQEGYATSHDMAIWKIIIGPILLAGAAVCMIFVWKKRKSAN